jgi:hypothetical protein
MIRKSDLSKRNLSNLEQEFNLQRTLAEKTEVTWSITFNEWLTVWLFSDKLGERNTAHFELIRIDKEGGFSADNVSIDIVENATVEISKLRSAYTKQRYSVTKQRGIKWTLSFEQWLSIWAESGKLSQRGHNGFILTRIKEKQPFSLDNVHVIAHKLRASEKTEFERSSISKAQTQYANERVESGFYGYVRTPIGVFVSVPVAADAHRMTASGFAKRLKNANFPDYKRLSQEDSKKVKDKDLIHEAETS